MQTKLIKLLYVYMKEYNKNGRLCNNWGSSASDAYVEI